MRHLLFVILAFFIITPQLASTAKTNQLTARETMRNGRGTIRHVEWHPDGDLILVDTASGAWLYDDNLYDVAHLPDIRLARFSPDGRYIAGVNRDDELLIYDAQTRDLLHTLAQHDHHIRELHWQGNRLATYDGYQLVLWEDLAVTAVIDWRLLEMITWNPSGTLLVAKQLNGKLLVVNSAGEWWEIVAPNGETAELYWKNDTTILHIYYTNDDTRLIQVMSFIDSHTGTAVKLSHYTPDKTYEIQGGWRAMAGYDDFFVLDSYDDEFNSFALRSLDKVAWSDDHSRVAYAYEFSGFLAPDEPMVYVIDLYTKTTSTMHNLGSYTLTSMVWQPSGNLLLTVDGEERIHLWHAKTGIMKAVTQIHSQVTEHFSISPTGQLLVFADMFNGFEVWNEYGKRYEKSAHLSTVEFILWQPHGSLLATSSQKTISEPGAIDPRIMLWDGDTGNTIDIIQMENAPQDLEWRPDGKVLGIATYPDVGFWDGTLTVYSSEQMQIGTYGLVREINWSPDSRYIGIVHKPGTPTIETFWLYDNLRNVIISSMLHSSHGSDVSFLAWNAGEWRRLTEVPFYYSTWGYDWPQHAAPATIVQTIYPTESEMVFLERAPEPFEDFRRDTPYVWSPDTTYIVAHSRNHLVRVWNSENGAFLYETEGYAFAFSPDSQYLAVLTDTHVNLLNARTGEIILAIDEARFPQDEYTLQWSDDGSHLAIGGEGVVSVWEIKPE